MSNFSTLSKEFNMYYQNVNGINGKEINFIEAVNCETFDFVCLTESWLKTGNEHFVQLSRRYNVVRKDRDLDLTNTSKGGGCVLLINSEYNFEILPIPFLKLDIILVKVKITGTSPIIVGLHYFPPNVPVSDFKSYCDWLCHFIIYKACRVIIIGDFNAGGINWATGTVTSKHYYSKLKADAIVELSSVLELKQLNRSYNPDDPTSTLDLLMTNITDSSIHFDVHPLMKIDFITPRSFFNGQKI